MSGDASKRFDEAVRSLESKIGKLIEKVGENTIALAKTNTRVAVLGALTLLVLSALVGLVLK